MTACWRGPIQSRFNSATTPATVSFLPVSTRGWVIVLGRSSSYWSGSAHVGDHYPSSLPWRRNDPGVCPPAGRSSKERHPVFYGGVERLITVFILTTQRREIEQTELWGPLKLELVITSDQKTAKIIELIEELRRDMPQVHDGSVPRRRPWRSRPIPKSCSKRSRKSRSSRSIWRALATHRRR